MNQLTINIRGGRKGDVVLISGHRVGERERIGEILEVLGEEDRVHYRVRWEDGNESVFYPGSDASIRRSSADDAAEEGRGTSAPSSALIEVLEASDVSYELIPHRPTMTAAAEAHAVGVDPGHVAKTLVLTSDDGFVRAVLPASQRIDLRKVEAVLARDVSLASERVLAGAYPEFELGAVPPVGGARDLVLVDRRVSDAGYVVFDAGCHDQSLRMSSRELIDVAGARVVDICEG